MGNASTVSIGIALCVGLVGVPRIVGAQGSSTAEIAGVVRDTSGGVLPGVTVEVSSPALTEKVRTTVTADDGQYRLVELRPGTYSVKFTLAGFATFVREGVELPVNFAATINAELRVGTLDETITVTGENPLIDLQNVRDQARITREQVDNLPSNRGLYGYAAFTPAIVIAPRTQDVGGSQGELKIAISVHGSREDDYKTRQDGMPVTNMQQSGSARGYVINPLVAGETVVDLGAGGSAEQSTGGAQVNVIPRDGANTFKGTFFTSGTSDALQGNNLTQALKDQGLTKVNGVDEMHDFNGMFSGPILRDRLWFLTAHREWGRTQIVGDLYEQDRSGAPFVYKADLSKPVRAPENNRAHNGRLAWQGTSKDKFTFNYDWQFYHGSNNQGTLGPTQNSWENKGNAYCPATRLYQTNWTRPQSNRWLLEGGFSRLEFEMRRGTPGETFTLPSGKVIDPYGDTACNDYSGFATIVEQSPGPATAPASWNGVGFRQHRLQIHQNLRFTTSYVTGAHAFKAGIFTQHGTSDFFTVRDGIEQTQGLPVAYRFNGGVPNRLTQYVTSLPDSTRGDEFALFAQDSWRMGRVTLNYGLRYEYMKQYAPAVDIPAGVLNDARSLPKVDCVPCWHDLSPRAAISYDPFGDGKTAVKFAIGRYTAGATIELVQLLGPATAFIPNTTRTWNDTDGDFFPDCDLRNLGINGECRAVANANFGGTNLTTTPDPDWITGWGKRGYNWTTSVSFEREIFTGLAMNAGFHRRWYGNQFLIDNKLVTPADYDPYCLTAPTDARLGSISGSQICGLYDIKPEKFGQEELEYTHAKNFGDYKEWFNGFDLGLQARLPRGARVSGGFAIGNTAGDNAGTGSTRVMTERCFVVDSPQAGAAIDGNIRSGLFNCKDGIPYRTQFKVNGAVPLPWQFLFSAVFQTIPGPAYQALVTYSAAEVSAALGRPVSGGGNVTIDLFAPFSHFLEDRVNQFDIRLAKIVSWGKLRFQLNADAYNVFNASAILNPEGVYGTGASYLRPIHVLDARLFKFGLQVDF